jgi:5-methylcytosine-specific restriction endonuclease McrA
MKEVLERMFEIRFAADDELMELIRWMKSHLSHKFPKGASYLEIFKYAIKYLKQREDIVNYEAGPRKSETKTNTRYIPKTVKQRVWKKYDGKCAFVGSNGKRCNSDYLLQFDHYPIPFARGGPGTVDNLRLLCAKHNRHMAERVYGEAIIKKHYIKEAPGAYLTAARLLCASRSAVMRQ